MILYYKLSVRYEGQQVGKQWAYYDEEGDVVRIIDHPAEGALPYPPEIYTLPLDHPDWDNPLF